MTVHDFQKNNLESDLDDYACRLADNGFISRKWSFLGIPVDHYRSFLFVVFLTPRNHAQESHFLRRLVSIN